MKKTPTIEKAPARLEIVRQINLPYDGRILRRSKYPVADLDVGDALVTSKELARNVAIAARTYAARHDWQFITRSLGDGKTAIVRVA